MRSAIADCGSRITDWEEEECEARGGDSDVEGEGEGFWEGVNAGVVGD